MGKELGRSSTRASREEAYVFSVFLDLRHRGGDALLDLGTHGLPIASVVTSALS
jgi:hypothetical protein